jgi:hypothetical protein
MKKYLFLIATLFLTGCFPSEDDFSVSLKSDLRYTKEMLETCQAQLEVYRGNTSSDTPKSDPEPTSTPEPQCYDVEYDVLYLDGKKLDTCLHENYDVKECGVATSGCESGLTYVCLKNVSYKTITKEECD